MTPRRTRTPQDGPWSWQSKAALRRIREAFDETNNVATAIAVYAGLCEIASDAGAEEFTTTHSWIRQISGVSVRTIQGHLKVFADLGLIAVSTARLRAPSTYRLLAFGNGCATFGNDCRAFGNGFHPPLPTSEEKKETLLVEHAERIYGLYPRKVAKKAALKAIAKALKTVPGAKLTDAVTAYAAAVAQWPDGEHKFIPHPATWFNEGRYEDDPVTWTRNGHPVARTPATQEIKFV